MARRPKHPPLRVYQNDQLVGYLRKEASGIVEFSYEQAWLERENAFPVSLSLPLDEGVYRGAPVVAVFDNLLPDSDALRRRIAEKVGADGTDVYSMLARIGRDCVGALQFVAGDEELPESHDLSGEAVDDRAVERLLQNLVQTPLGLDRDDAFRISIAGAQEKTALLLHNGVWLKPHGTTPTTHIIKTQIGTLPNGVDLSDSVENEFYCLSLARAFGLPVNDVRMQTFNATKALVIARFDRRWTKSGRLLRLPQEDCCQALSIPPTRKYQNDGGPGIADILRLLSGSDVPAEDQKRFLLAQMFFWIIGATDGHAKNFSLFLGPGGSFRLTPFYDVLTAQPSLTNHQINRRQMKLAMSVGGNRHYRVDEIHPRHFVETARSAGMAVGLVDDAMAHVAEAGTRAFTAVEEMLPGDFPWQIHECVRAAALPRIQAFAEMAGAG